MRKIFPMSFLAALALVVSGCGGGDDAFQNPDDPDDPNAPQVASISALASSPQLLSDDSAPVTITARVLNASNQAMADVSVIFQASSGVLTDIEATTNESGIATAVLHNSGDLTVRDITVTATAGDESDSVTVNVSGTLLTLPGAVSIVQGAQTKSTITLLDAGRHPIVGEEVTLTSDSGNTLSASTVTTDSNGKAEVTVTGSVAGRDTLTATALGLTATQTITVSDDSFAFTDPDENTEIDLGDKEVVSVKWTIAGVDQNNEDIEFATTRGVLYDYTGTCQNTVLAGPVATVAGVASACIGAANAGPATVTATTDDGTVANRIVEFVAIDPDSMNLQPSPATVTIGGQSTITAVVRDPDNNLVKNQVVAFTLTDVTGGSLSVPTDVTDSQGRAQTVYTASSVTSAAGGVRIDAVVQGGSGVTASTSLTVAQRELFITLGTGNELEEPNPAQYSVPYAIQVSDANGNGVANIDLTVRVLSLWYGTGVRAFLSGAWRPVFNDVCIDEDASFGAGTEQYRNGILDLVNGVPGTGEDFNSTGMLEAGNIATVTPTHVITDEDGFALIDVVYPQEYADWIKVELSASTTVQGTESVRSVRFVLPALADDVNDEDSAPPGPISPFGIANYACPDPSTFP